MNNIIESNNAVNKLKMILDTTKYNIKIHDIHNIEYRDKWSLNKKTIDDYLFAYIREGSGYYSIDGTECSIEKGRMVIISPSITFCAVQYDITPSLISVRFGVNNKFNEKVDNTSPFYVSTITNSELYQQYFENLNSRYALSDINPIYSDSCNTYLTYMLQEYLIALDANKSTNECDMRLQSIKLYIDKNIHTTITLQKLCSISGLSYPYVGKLFKEQYGITIKQYIFKTKMKRAYVLLKDREYNVKSVAFSLGYSDPYIFSNQFKKYYGYSPSRVKKQ